MTSTDYSVPISLFKRGKPINGTNIALSKVLNGVLYGLNVPFQDPCCEPNESRPVRTTGEGVLQTYYNGEWIPVAAGGLTFSEGLTNTAGVVTLGGTIATDVEIVGIANPNMFFRFFDDTNIGWFVNNKSGIRIDDFITNIGDVNFQGNATVLSINDNDRSIGLGTMTVYLATNTVDLSQGILTDFTLSPKTVSAATYMLTPSDTGRIINFTHAVGVVVTIPGAGPFALPVGFTVTLVQQGTGPITFSAGAVTFNNRQSQFTSAGQYAVLSLFSTALHTYILGGDTA